MSQPSGNLTNPFDPGARDDPFPALAHLRESDPVNEAAPGLWRLLRYDDCVWMLQTAPAGVRRSDGTIPGGGALKSPRLGDFMLQQDPPAHTCLRRLVSQAFTRRAVERLRPRVQAVVDELLDAVQHAGRMDVVADLAFPVPGRVICAMLGVPFSDSERFSAWSAQATHGLAGPLAPPDAARQALEASEALADYFDVLVAERRADPQDDLVSAMIRVEVDGQRLGHGELLTQAIGLLVAGFETTMGLIANGVATLARHPEQLEKLRRDPSLVASAIEECLRFAGPVLMTVRFPHADTELRGRVIPRDAQILVMLGAANRDPARFPDPDRFDIERRENPHLAFGGGAHFCLGAQLARLEAQLAILGIARRFANLELETPRIEWGPSLFRVPARLPVRFESLRT